MGRKTRSIGEFVLCSFCNDQVAFLYCLVDSAKLCLRCDQHVHSANALCRRHLRLPICDNCGSEPVSICCATDKLFLCEECDQDAHGSCPPSATHVRKPVGGFSGNPSPTEIASAWGFEIVDKRAPVPVDSGPSWGDVFLDSWMGSKEVSPSGLLQDIIAPNHHNSTVIYPTTEGSGGSSGGGDDQLEPRTLNGSGGGLLDSWISSKEISPWGLLQDLIGNPAVFIQIAGGRLTKTEIMKQLLRSLETHLLDDDNDGGSSGGGNGGRDELGCNLNAIRFSGS